jgi:hypothetical protein
MTKSALFLIDELREGASGTQKMVLDNRADYLRRLTVAALCKKGAENETSLAG